MTALNRCTAMAGGWTRPSRWDPRPVFVAHYASLRRLCAHVDSPGLAIAAIDTRRGGLAGAVLLEPAPAHPAALVIGRHTQAGLWLDADDAVSLRHVLVVVEPVRSWRRGTTVRYRILDLRTPRGFSDEHGRALTSVIADGPAFFRLGDYILMCLQTGDPTDWPANPNDAWAMLPARIFADERGPHSAPRPRPQHAAAPAPAPNRGGRTTLVTAVPGAAELGSTDGTRITGRLHIRSPLGTASVAISAGIATRGILLGRYDRCDLAERQLLALEDISRVHLAILQLGNQLVAVDTASTNGTTCAVGTGGPWPLETAGELVLGNGTVRLLL